MGNITFKQLENGQIVQVVTNTITEEVPFSKEEIKRQISEHSEIVKTLQSQLQAVEEFEKNTEASGPIQLETEITNPVINQEVLDAIIDKKDSV